MWRDRWFIVSVIGAAGACLACLTPVAAVILGAIGFGGWVGRLDLIVVPALVAFAALLIYRYRVACRRAP
jgi:mercuric ion transport protein